MSAIINLAEMDRRQRGLRLCDGKVVERVRRRIAKGAALFGLGMIVGRHFVCHAAAAAFCVAVVIPVVMIFGDRTLPFDYVHSYMKPATVRAGEPSTAVFAISPVRKDCHGDFSRWLIDAAGQPFHLGTFIVDYRHKQVIVEGDPDKNGDRAVGSSFEKPWFTPRKAAEGPALYEAHVRFWCNWFQRAYPIETNVKIPIYLLKAAP